MNGESQEAADCREVLAEVYLYLDLECDEGRRGLIQTHLDECSPCLREFGIEQEVKALVARCCGGESAPTELRDRLRMRIEEIAAEPSFEAELRDLA
ncbi:mycothiol system anti-sigma-R factor [Longispora sp. NPDC051575]|uniref:mycothiol system anti-sigma-R factor n=1 Tax=Longispora sp. NPDC051575 TaxID=3154943 RepID=UPI00341E2F0E